MDGQKTSPRFCLAILFMQLQKTILQNMCLLLFIKRSPIYLGLSVFSNCENQKKDEDRDLSDDQEDESIETSNSEEETEEEEDVDRDEENI